MRHVLLSRTVATAAFGMGEAAMAARLVAPTRSADRVPPRRRRAAAGAVDLAMVAGAANQYLHAAARAEEESARGFHWRSKSRQGAVDRDFRLVEYSPCTRARHGVGHDIGVNLAVWAGVVPVLFGGIFLPHLELSCHPRRLPLPIGGRAAEGAFPVALRAPSNAPSAAPFRTTPETGIPGKSKHRYRLRRQCHGARFTRISTAIHKPSSSTSLPDASWAGV